MSSLIARVTGKRATDSTPQDTSPKDDLVAQHSIVEKSPTTPTENESEDQPGELTFIEAEQTGLGRHLGVFSTTFLIIGRIIGTGIFSTPSSILSGVGSVGAALFLWVLGFLLSFAGLAVWLEFGCMFPRSGGEKVYLEAVYKKPKLLATILFAFNAIFLGFTASGCIIFASNVLVAAGHTVSEWAERGIAIAVISFVTIIHGFFPRVGVGLMNALGVFKVFILLFIIVTGWVVLSGHTRVADPHVNFRNGFAGSVHSSNPYATALFKVLNSYTGWSNAAYVLNEVKNPVRTIKIAAPLGLSICGILYMLANVSYFAAASVQEITHAGTTVAALFFENVFGQAAGKALAVFVALSAIGNVLTVTFAQSRVNQELAKEGVIPWPRFWASNWPVGAPLAGLIVHLIPSLVVIIAVPFGDAYNFILDVEGYPGQIINLFVVLGLIWLRYRHPNLKRPYKAWSIAIFFFLVGAAFLLVAPFLRPPGGKGDTSLPYFLYPLVGIAVFGLGIVYWAVWRLFLPKIGNYNLEPQKSHLKDGTTVVTYVKVKNV